MDVNIAADPERFATTTLYQPRLRPSQSADSDEGAFFIEDLLNGVLVGRHSLRDEVWRGSDRTGSCLVDL
jgi:hypothetical protein